MRETDLFACEFRRVFVCVGVFFLCVCVCVCVCVIT